MTLKVINPSNWVPNIKGQYGIALDGDVYAVLNGNQTWSLTTPDANTMRFEVRKGDVYSWDAQYGDAANRSEIADSTVIKNGTPLNVSYQFNLEPGSPNTAAWMAIGQLHQDTDTNNAPWGPPFDIGMQGEKMTIDIKYTGADGNPVSVRLFTDVANIQRGHYYDISITAVVDPNGNGRLMVSRDGVTLTDYSGPLGYTSENGVSWKEGVYRANNATETIAADYRNLAVTTGSAVTIPDPSEFIAAPVVGVSSVANPAADGSRLVALTGTAKLGTSVTLYENGVAIGTATVDANGHFVSQITVQGTGEHLISAVATDATGRNGLTMQPMAIEIGTSAAIVARMDTIAAQSNIGAIVLTDTSVLTVTSTTQMATLKGHDGAALAKIQGGYSFLVVQSVTGQAYNIQTVAYNAAGVITERMRYAGSTLIYDLQIAADGSSLLKTVNATGGTDIALKATDGFTESLSHFTAGGRLASSEIYGRDGSKSYYSYSLTTGQETGFTFIAADKSSVNVTLGITGQAFTTQAFSFDSTGKLVLQQRFAENGREISAFSWGPNGEYEVHNYSAATGQETSFVVHSADGSHYQAVYGITGQSYTEQTTYYDKTGRIVNVTTSNATGSVPATFPETFGPSESTYTQTNADGSYTISLFAAGLPGQLTRLNSYSATGTLTETDIFNTAGQRTSTDVFNADGSDLLTRFDPTSGLAIGTTKTYADGSNDVAVFAAGVPGQIASLNRYNVSGTLMETDLYDGSGHKISVTIFGADGSSLLTSYDPASGLATGLTQTDADGSKSITVYASGAPGQIASVNYYNASGALFETDLYDASGHLISTTNPTPTNNGPVITYDPVTGIATGYTQTNPDGSSIVATYMTGSTSQLASLNNYTRAGALTAAQLWGSDGSHKVYTFKSAGVENGYTVFRADGSKTVATFVAGNEALLIQASLYNATGFLAETDKYNAAGVKVSAITKGTDGSHGTYAFDPVTGAETRATIYNADRTRTEINLAVTGRPYTAQTAIYTSTNALVSMTRQYGDANRTVAFTQTVNPDGSQVIHNYDTSGRETVRQMIAADGSKDVFAMSYTGTSTTPTTIQDDHYGPNKQKLWTDVTYADGSHKTTALASGVTLNAAIGSSDILASSKAGGDGFVFAPAFGQDIVTNFHTGTGANADTIDLTAFGIPARTGQSNADFLAQSLSQKGHDALLSVTGTDGITLKNVLVPNVTSNNIRLS